MNKNLEHIHHQTFEEIRQTNNAGEEFWLARQLAKILEYADFRNFLLVIEKARQACKNSGHAEKNHFVEITEMVNLGSGAEREVKSFALSRYACYLIVQNGDPAKPVIAKGIHTKKGLKKSQNILDNMGSTELAANLFRATQTEEKLRRENIQGKARANQTHYEVGKKVRKTIEELGGTMPEDLPTPEEDLKKLERRVKSAEKKLPKTSKLPQKPEDKE